MRQFLIVSAIGLAAFFAANTTVAQMVESPIYRSWAKVPVGTTIVHHSVTDNGNDKVETTFQYTLVELDREKAIIELVKTEGAAGGTAEPGTPLQYTIRRDFPLLPGVKKEDIGKPSNAVARGEETITVAGKEYQAQWYDTKGQTEAGPSLTRTWMTDDVPGKTLRSITRVDAVNSVTTLELVELKAP